MSKTTTKSKWQNPRQTWVCPTQIVGSQSPPAPTTAPQSQSTTDSPHGPRLLHPVHLSPLAPAVLGPQELSISCGLRLSCPQLPCPCPASSGAGRTDKEPRFGLRQTWLQSQLSFLLTVRPWGSHCPSLGLKVLSWKMEIIRILTPQGYCETK